MIDTLLPSLRHVQNKVLIDLPLDCAEEIKTKLHIQGIRFSAHLNAIEISNVDSIHVHATIRESITPNLLPTQFYWLLVKSGLEAATNTLLEQLQITDPDQYAIYKAFLQGARHYEFNKAIDMLNQAKPLIEQSYPDIDLSVATLRSLWLQASKF